MIHRQNYEKEFSSTYSAELVHVSQSAGVHTPKTPNTESSTTLLENGTRRQCLLAEEGIKVITLILQWWKSMVYEE